MTEDSKWTLKDSQQKLLDMARRMRPNLKITTPGRAAGARTAPRSAARPAPSTTAPPASFDTSATATAPALTETSPRPATTSATATWGSSSGFTDWTQSPLGFVENGSLVNIETLAGLPEATQRSLRSLATGNGQPEWAMVQAICEYFIESESEWAELPLVDALDFYFAQHQLR